jgi:hypothetical protein
MTVLSGFDIRSNPGKLATLVYQFAFLLFPLEDCQIAQLFFSYFILFFELAAKLPSRLWMRIEDIVGIPSSKFLPTLQTILKGNGKVEMTHYDTEEN